jgi:hypothetical protein
MCARSIYSMYARHEYICMRYGTKYVHFKKSEQYTMGGRLYDVRTYVRSTVVFIAWRTDALPFVWCTHVSVYDVQLYTVNRDLCTKNGAWIFVRGRDGVRTNVRRTKHQCTTWRLHRRGHAWVIGYGYSLKEGLKEWYLSKVDNGLELNYLMRHHFLAVFTFFISIKRKIFTDFLTEAWKACNETCSM